MRSDDPRRGIVLPDPEQVARKVRIRRWKRRMKAAMSIALAAAAGTFLACDTGEKKPQPNVPPNPTTPEISNLPAAHDAGIDAAADASADAAIDAQTTALVRRDAGTDAKVDREEHRKGMPVRDNLLE